MTGQIREDVEVFVSCAVEASRQVQVFGELFDNGDSVAAVNLMPETFAILKLALLKTVVIGVCAFFDPPKTRDDENLSLPYLERKYADRLTPEIKERISSARGLYTSLNVAKYRSKYLAHRDLLHFTKAETITHDLTTQELQRLLVLLMEVGLKIGSQPLTGEELYAKTRLLPNDSGQAIISLLTGG